MQNISPIDQNQRTAIVDILRGWALIGVVLVNYFLFFYLDKSARIASDEIPSKLLKILTSIFFTNKSRLMLNVLFGYGFSVLIANLKIKNINPVSFFSRRMFWLFIIAILNTCLYYGDFLKDYALLGIVMLFFYKASVKASMYCGLLLLLIFPFTSNFYSPTIANSTTDLKLYESHNIFNVFYYGLKDGLKDFIDIGKLLGVDLLVLACFLIGQFFQKIDIFNKIAENKKYIIRTFFGSFIATILFTALPRLSDLLDLKFFNHYDIQFWPELSQMFAIMSAICWLYISGKLKWFFKSLQMVGRMTLTNYIIQNLLGLLLFSGFGFGLLHKLPFYSYILLAVVIYILQIYSSKWWLSKYQYGPVEWIWRMLSYGKILPIKKVRFPDIKFA